MQIDMEPNALRDDLRGRDAAVDASKTIWLEPKNGQ